MSHSVRTRATPSSFQNSLDVQSAASRLVELAFNVTGAGRLFTILPFCQCEASPVFNPMSL